MAQYVETRSMPLPAEAVWAVMSDLPRWPDWTTSMKSIEALDTPPPAVGSRFKVRQPRLPALIWTIQDWVPGSYFSWTSNKGGVASRAEHRITPTSDGCDVSLAVIQTGPAAGISGLLFGRLTKQFLLLELEGLEKQASPH